jgi:large repetitive protein
MIPGIRAAGMLGFSAAVLSMSPGSGALTGAVQNAAYSTSVAASGGTLVTYAITLGSLPAGLSFNTSTGAITGTPSSFGSASFTIKATDVSGAFVSASYSITVSQRVFSFLISASQNNINLATIAANPTGGTGFQYIFTISSGVLIGSTDHTTYSLQTGSFPAGSFRKLINNGQVIGKEGSGGGGGANGNAGSDGVYGGTAISLDCDISIDNTGAGNIFGAGGGGGGGGGGESGISLTAGGAGGAGRGSGNTGSAGSGGAGTADGFGGSSGAGGPGGNYGTAGSAGGASSTGGTNIGGNGAAAGKAITLNGFAVTWIAGNNSTQVKGAVS